MVLRAIVQSSSLIIFQALSLLSNGLQDASSHFVPCGHALGSRVMYCFRSSHCLAVPKNIWATFFLLWCGCLCDFCLGFHGNYVVPSRRPNFNRWPCTGCSGLVQHFEVSFWLPVKSGPSLKDCQWWLACMVSGRQQIQWMRILWVMAQKTPVFFF